MMLRLFLAVFLALLCSMSHARLLVSTIHPIHLIAQAVTAGIETPMRLIDPKQDGHHLQLTAAQRKALQDADLVLWIGPNYEHILEGALHQAPNQVALSGYPLLTRHPLRTPQAQPIRRSLDPHLWLDPNNAINMAHHIAEIRARQFPQDAGRYRQNAQRFAQDMQTLVRTTHKPRPYLAYHDAYQYLENIAQLQLVASLTVDHDIAPSAHQLQATARQLKQQSMCLITSQSLSAGHQAILAGAKVKIVDETLSQSAQFIDGYRQLLQYLQDC